MVAIVYCVGLRCIGFVGALWVHALLFGGVAFGFVLGWLLSLLDWVC